MIIDADYHTHTVYSHGTGSIRDNVEVAIEKGLKKIAICDHGPGHYLYGVKAEDLFIMRKEIDSLNEEFKGKIEILLGLEANLVGFDGTIDVNEEILEILDILLMGYHYGTTPKRIRDFIGFYIVNPLIKVIPIGRKKVVKMNTQAYIKAINKYNIDIITHPGSKIEIDIDMLSKALEGKTTALEINSKHGELSIESIERAKKYEVDFVLGSDAHRPEDVGNINKSLSRAKEAGLALDRIINIRKEV